MSAWVANTTVTILRGQDDDDYGDPMDNTTAAASGIPASICEINRSVRRRSDGTPRTVRQYVGRVPGCEDVRVGDRLRDENTGTIYPVVSVRRPPTVIADQDWALELSRNT